MRQKNAAGFRRPEPGPTDNVGKVPDTEGTPRDDEDITGQFHQALDEAERVYDACREQAERSLRKIAGGSRR